LAFFFIVSITRYSVYRRLFVVFFCHLFKNVQLYYLKNIFLSTSVTSFFFFFVICHIEIFLFLTLPIYYSSGFQSWSWGPRALYILCLPYLTHLIQIISSLSELYERQTKCAVLWVPRARIENHCTTPHGVWFVKYVIVLSFDLI